MQDFEIQNIGSYDDSQYIARSNNVKWLCILVISIHSKQIRKENTIQMTTDLQDKIAAYELNQSLFHDRYMVEIYSYNADSQNFKVNHKFYSSTLYSVRLSIIDYVEKIEIISKIAHIVEYLHSQSICIRNLNPRMLSFTKFKSEISVKMIWMDSSIELSSTDSLISNSLDIKQSSPIYKYVAPQIKGKKNYGIKADVWSLGVIFYELLFGNTSDIKYRKQQVQIQYPKNTPRWLYQILSKFLEEDATKRCSIKTCLNYLKPLRCCAETASKLIPIKVSF